LKDVTKGHNTCQVKEANEREETWVDIGASVEMHIQWSYVCILLKPTHVYT